jgi:hypothetical protein
MCPSVFYRFISHGRDVTSKSKIKTKNSIKQSKNWIAYLSRKLASDSWARTMFSVFVYKVTNCALYASRVHQMNLKYLQENKKKNQAAATSKTWSRFHIFFFIVVSFTVCGRPDFHQWKFLKKHILLRSHYKTQTIQVRNHFKNIT